MYKVIIKNYKTKQTRVIICKTFEEAKALEFEMLVTEDYASVKVEAIEG